MNAIAEAHGFLVLYPDEPASVQMLKCWQWFDPAHQHRGSGEPAELVALVDHVATSHAVDGARVYVAGLSAGAAMSVILGATYPDRFSAIVVAAGLEYGAASSLPAASTAQFQGGPDPVRQGMAAATAMAGASRPVRVLVFHGTQDPIVAPLNGDQVVAQWRTTNGILGVDLAAAPAATEPLQVTGGRSYTRTRWDSGSMTWIEKISVDGMGHAWPGGAASASFTDPQAPNASEQSWSFFADTPPNGSGAGAGGSTPDGHHGGCAMALAGAEDGLGSSLMLVALGLLAARKRATPSAWIRCSGSPSCPRSLASTRVTTRPA
jgi:poly(hydroxyalkanoate) depolymerase family esterase